MPITQSTRRNLQAEHIVNSLKTRGSNCPHEPLKRIKKAQRKVATRKSGRNMSGNSSIQSQNQSATFLDMDGRVKKVHFELKESTPAPISASVTTDTPNTFSEMLKQLSQRFKPSTTTTENFFSEAVRDPANGSVYFTKPNATANFELCKASPLKKDTSTFLENTDFENVKVQCNLNYLY